MELRYHSNRSIPCGKEGRSDSPSSILSSKFHLYKYHRLKKSLVEKEIQQIASESKLRQEGFDELRSSQQRDLQFGSVICHI